MAAWAWLRARPVAGPGFGESACLYHLPIGIIHLPPDEAKTR
jgi:hypothetical protein